MKKLITILLIGASSAGFADIFSAVAKLEKLDASDTTTYDALNTQEYISPIFYVGEKNPRFELSFPMRTRKDALQIRLDYPDAWRKIRNDEIDEFSYFGFKLYDVEQGTLGLEELLKELQEYINRYGN